MPTFPIDVSKSETRIQFRYGKTTEYDSARQQGFRLLPAEIAICYSEDGVVEKIVTGAESDDTVIWPNAMNGRYRSQLSRYADVEDDTDLLFMRKLEDAWPPEDGVWPTYPHVSVDSSTPSVDDNLSKGYAVASIWFCTTNNHLYICKASTNSSATWVDVTYDNSIPEEIVPFNEIITLQPNVLHRLSSLDSCSIALATPVAGRFNFYDAVFKVKDGATITWPSNLQWPSGSEPKLSPGYRYRLKIIMDGTLPLAELQSWADCPDFSLNFTLGLVDPILVCTRSTVDYVLNENGKYEEVPANTLGISYETGTPGAQLFNTRTRLNRYYKSRIVDVTRLKTSLIDSASVQAGTQALRMTVPSLVENNIYEVNFSDNLQLPAKDTQATVSIRARKITNRAITLGTRLRGTKDSGTTFVANLMRADFELAEEFQVFTSTQTLEIPEGATEYTLQISVGASLVANDTQAGDTVELDWVQLEYSPYRTPLIMGSETSQVTVNRTEVVVNRNYVDPTLWKTYSVVAEGWTEKHTGRMWQIALPEGTAKCRTYVTSAAGQPVEACIEDNSSTPKRITTSTMSETFEEHVKTAAWFDFDTKALKSAANGTLGPKKVYTDNYWDDETKVLRLSSAKTSSVYLDGYVYGLSVYLHALSDEDLKAKTILSQA